MESLSQGLVMLVPTSSNGEIALMPMCGRVVPTVYVQKRPLSHRINGASMYLEAVSCYFHSWAEDRNENRTSLNTHTNTHRDISTPPHTVEERLFYYL